MCIRDSDDPEDAEAVIGEINSVSGDFNLVLQQGGVVSVKEDGELFATEVVCDVAEGEQRRRLPIEETEADTHCAITSLSKRLRTRPRGPGRSP